MNFGARLAAFAVQVEGAALVGTYEVLVVACVCGGPIRLERQLRRRWRACAGWCSSPSEGKAKLAEGAWQPLTPMSANPP